MFSDGSFKFENNGFQNCQRKFRNKLFMRLKMSANRKHNTKQISGFAPLASSTIFGSRLRLDLDSTRISTSDSSGRNNNIKLDYAYNEYLQAMAKKRIISSSFHQFEILLQQQIDYQKFEIIKMKEECEQKEARLQNVIGTNQLVIILKEIEDKLEEFEKSTEQENLNQLISLSNILGAAARKLQLVGVKSLSNKEEWLLLVKIMNECCKFLKSFFKSHKSIKEFELIDEISGKLKETLELQTNIQERIAISSSVSKTSSIKYIEKMKSLFDLLGTTSRSN